MQRTTLDKSNNGWTELIFLREKMWIFDLVLNTLTTYHLVGPYQYISTLKNIQRQCLKTIIYIFGLFATIPHFWSSQSHVIPVLGLNYQQHVGSLHLIIISTTGALRIGAVREPSYHPSTYSFWAFKPVYTKSFWPWVPTFNELGLSLSAVERGELKWGHELSSTYVCLLKYICFVTNLSPLWLSAKRISLILAVFTSSRDYLQSLQRCIQPVIGSMWQSSFVASSSVASPSVAIAVGLVYVPWLDKDEGSYLNLATGNLPPVARTERQQCCLPLPGR